MGAVCSYPGVYVEEDHSLSLSVTSGATAVPAFVCKKEEFDLIWTATPPVQRIDSWLDVVAAVEGKDASGTVIYRSLQAYFQNGGGYCYVFSWAANAELSQVLGYDDITLLVEAGSGAKAKMVLQCKEETRLFGIFDHGSASGIGVSGAEAEATAFGAEYFPWLEKAVKNETDGKIATQDIPPSAAVAGVYCTVDRERGVWKAPANVTLKGGLRVKCHVSDATQGGINVSAKPVNIIRRFGDGAPIVWGARTLANDDRWRFIPVRRLFNAVEKDIKKAMGFAVFEPNSAPTWERVRAAIDSYLHALWKEGALMGAKPEEAYSVLIGKGVTMTEQDINEGKMIVKIGLAAVRPAEFIVLKFSQQVGIS